MSRIAQGLPTRKLNANGWRLFNQQSPTQSKYADVVKLKKTANFEERSFRNVVSASVTSNPVVKCIGAVTEMFDRMKYIQYFGAIFDSNLPDLLERLKSYQLDEEKMLIGHRDLKEYNQLVNAKAFRFAKSTTTRHRVLGEVDEVRDGEAVVTFNDSRIGWHTIVVSTSRMQFPLVPNMVIPIDVWFDSSQGVSQYRIPQGISIRNVQFNEKPLPKRVFLEEPDDYSDPEVVADYERRLEGYFQAQRD